MTAHRKVKATPSGPDGTAASAETRTSASQPRNMPSKLNAYLLTAVMLAALLQCAPGAPAGDAPTDSPAGDTSGEEEEEGEEETSSDLLSDSKMLEQLLDVTKRHQKQFEEEFQTPIITYLSLDPYRISALPACCPASNFSKEACLRRLAQGLSIYTFLLKHVEKENPGSQIFSEVRHRSGLLIPQIKEKMRNPGAVTALTSSQEEQLLKDFHDPDPFRRKMTAHSILRQLHHFVLAGKRAIVKREKLRGGRAKRSAAPVSFFYQTLR